MGHKLNKTTKTITIRDVMEDKFYKHSITDVLSMKTGTKNVRGRRSAEWKDYLEGFSATSSIKPTQAQLDMLTKLGITNLDNLMLNHDSASVLIDKLLKK